MNPIEQFTQECTDRIRTYADNAPLQKASRAFIQESARARYTYNFRWLGRPIIQYPQDIVAIQDVLWQVQPDLVIETGIAHGGSLILSASILQLIGKGGVVGIDIDIRPHNREAIEAHPLSARIELVQGSSIAPEIVTMVRTRAKEAERVVVILDSNHTHDHVLAELRAYAELVTLGSYIIVMDTVVEEMPDGSYPDRPWDRGNNPWTAVQTFLRETNSFEVDADFNNRYLVTMARDGFLRRVR